MRELKFRAWNPEARTFVFLTLSEKLLGFVEYGFSGKYTPAPPLEPFRQFTGLLDKNGKEIYEGDIVRIDGGGEPAIAPVDFEGGCFVARGKWIAQHTDAPELKYYVGMSFCTIEVIGNIYENPELLEKAT